MSKFETALARPSVLACLAAVLMMSSCAEVKQGFVVREWGLKMRELAINPLFPPREDFYVGDFYLTPVRPDREEEVFKRDGFLPPPVWLASLNKEYPGKILLKEFYATRLAFPETTAASGVVPGLGTVSQFAIVPQATDSGNNVFEPRNDQTRLRLVGFPAFMSASISQGNLSILIPVEAFSFLIGGSFSDIESASISVPLAESAGVPAGVLYSTIIDNNKFDYCNQPAQNRSMIWALRPKDQAPLKGSDDSFFVTVPTEVYYARAIDVSILFSKSRGIAAGASLPVPAAPGGTAPAPAAPPAAAPPPLPVIPLPPATAVMSTGDIGTLSGTAKRLAEANTQLQAQLSRTTPGASISLLSVAEGAISLRRIYVRPIAIGYRGFVLEVNKSDCSIKGAAPTSSGLPLSTEGISIPNPFK